MNDSLRYIKRSVRKLSPYTPGEQPVMPVIKLNTNENPYPPSPRVAEALRALDPADLRRYPDPLSNALRQALAQQHGCRPEQVFAGNGSDEVLALATHAFVEDDGAIGYFEPSYSLYPVLTDARGVTARPVALDAAFQPVWPNADHAALFFVAHPNAPTGLAVPREALTDFCRAFNGVVVIDQAYADFAADAFDDLALTLPNVLSVRTFSKSHALAGLRVGYAIGPEPLIRALFTLKDSYNLDLAAQRLALAAVKDPDWMRQQAQRIRQTRQRLTDALRTLGWEVLDSDANFVWTRPAPYRAAEILDRLRRHQIVVRHFPGLRTGAYLRITVGTDAEIDALLTVLRTPDAALDAPSRKEP